MKIFVFEYITGGGLLNGPLCGPLLREGELMLRQLIADLLEVVGVEISLIRDWRMPVMDDVALNTVLWVSNAVDFKSKMQQGISDADAVWVIAPETDEILAGWCHYIEQQGKLLLTSGSQAVALTADKLQTANVLLAQQIPVVATEVLQGMPDFTLGGWVVKPRDGVGCSQCYLLQNQQDYCCFEKQWHGAGDFIKQPYIVGEVLSLSALFNNGHAKLLCCNQQCVDVIDKQFRLHGCVVNAVRRQHREFQALIDSIAMAIPGLWGYVGIDLIMVGKAIYVLEINPRLTTSYAGISAALKINVAQQVVAMARFETLQIPSDRGQTCMISILKDNI